MPSSLTVPIRLALLASLLCAQPALGDERPARKTAEAPQRKAGDPPPLHLRGGGPEGVPVDVTLMPSVVLALHADPEQAPREVVLTPSWRREPRAGAPSADDPAGDVERWKAEVTDEESGTRAILRLTTGTTAELTVEVRYSRRAWLSLSAIDFTLPGRAQVLDRDLAVRPAGPIAYLDRYGTKALRVGPNASAVTVLVDDGVDGVVVKRASGATPATDVRVELFSVEARPFLYDARCRDDWRLDNAKLLRPARLREAGDRDLTRIELRADQATTPLLSKSRWPEGRDAAIVVTDHADQSGPDSFTALARGRSDATTPVGGLLGHHLVITKSLFLRGEVNGEGRRQLEDQRVAAIADEMARQGSEIIPHSVTPDPDDRDATAAGLEAFNRFHGATWIDHQPETNCEAFTNQGWRSAGDRLAGKWRIGDLLSRHGYRYLWSAIDQDDEIDLLAAGHLDKRALTLWPVGRLSPGDPEDRWLFKTTWMLVEEEKFYTGLGAERLERLERDRGLALLHTYLESLHGNENPRFAGRNVLRRAPGGIIETTPRLEKVLAEIERRVGAGTLWMPTMAALGDWTQRVQRVQVRQESPGGPESASESGRMGSATVTAPIDLAGVTLHAPGDVEVLVDGAEPRGRRTERGATLFWFDLKANRPVRVDVRSRRPLNAERTPLPGPVVKSVAAARAE